MWFLFYFLVIHFVSNGEQRMANCECYSDIWWFWMNPMAMIKLSFTGIEQVRKQNLFYVLDICTYAELEIFYGNEFFFLLILPRRSGDENGNNNLSNFARNRTHFKILLIWFDHKIRSKKAPWKVNHQINEQNH